MTDLYYTLALENRSIMNLVFVTGRPERTRDVTNKWLSNFFGYNRESTKLLMRPNGDRRDDDILKKELTKDLEDVSYIFEDRPRVIKMYRKQFPSAIIIDCGDGKHFKEERNN